MQPCLFDTSIFISALRRGGGATSALRSLSAGVPVWLSAVVLEELYAGAGDRDFDVVERLERDFKGIKRILVPSLSDWAQAGRVLARLAAKYDYEEIGRGRLTNDALIAMSAARSSILIITENARDFRRLGELRDFHWQIAGI